MPGVRRKPIWDFKVEVITAAGKSFTHNTEVRGKDLNEAMEAEGKMTWDNHPPLEQVVKMTFWIEKRETP